MYLGEGEDKKGQAGPSLTPPSFPLNGGSGVMSVGWFYSWTTGLSTEKYPPLWKTFGLSCKSHYIPLESYTQFLVWQGHENSQSWRDFGGGGGGGEHNATSTMKAMQYVKMDVFLVSALFRDTFIVHSFLQCLASVVKLTHFYAGECGSEQNTWNQQVGERNWMIWIHRWVQHT